MIRLFVILFLMIHSTAVCQNVYRLKDLFTETQIVWYGIDYTQVEMVGTFTNKDLHEYYHGWNKLIIQESEKYNIAKALQRTLVTFDQVYVEQLNDQSTPIVLGVPSDKSIQKSDIAEMVSKYKSNQTYGIGLVFIAERYHKAKSTASHYAVFFDIATKKVLLSQRYTTAPGGMGVRNFWAPTIYSAIKLMAKNYKKWKKEYGNA